MEMAEEGQEERVSFPEWNTDWPRCEYEILGVPIRPSDAPLVPQVRTICAKKGAAVAGYDPVQVGRAIRPYGNYLGKEAAQPRRPEGDKWPVHLALARLDLDDESAIVRFCGRYGLLGLREIPGWKGTAPWPAPGPEMTGGIDSHSRWYDHPKPDPKPRWVTPDDGDAVYEQDGTQWVFESVLPSGQVEVVSLSDPDEPRYAVFDPADLLTGLPQPGHPKPMTVAQALAIATPTPEECDRSFHAWKVRTWCEPLDLFQKAALKYQDIYALWERQQGAPEVRPAESTSHKTPVTKSEIAAEVALRMDPYLRGCTFRPVFTKGRWVLGCQFRSLLDACYFRLLLDMTEGAGEIRRCADRKCNRFFLAPRPVGGARQGTDDDGPVQKYCCEQHRKRAFAASSADRQVKTRLRKIHEDGFIDRAELDAARAEVDRLYDKGNPDGMKDEVDLGEQVLAFLGLRPKSKKGV